ncbi:MAG: prepilin-type N-terminal cleavage/methylation domain-containing protein [Chthoniobacterales bacterium]
MRNFFRYRQSKSSAFTLIELLVATAILLVLLVVLAQLVGGIGDIWRTGSGKVATFQSARAAFTTIDRSVSYATLNTYYDYVDSSGNFRNPASAATFSPEKFARASELHWISGPTAEILPGASPATNPGDAVFFQAPLGETNLGGVSGLNRILNSLGFFIQYGSPDSSLLPAWLSSLAGEQKRFQLVQVFQVGENMKIYDAVANKTYPAVGADSWLEAFKLPPSGTQPRQRVLAEDIPLLLIRPRLSPKTEESAAGKLGITYSAAVRGSILSPHYYYDSRAWQSGHPSGRISAALAELTQNQLPPMVDIVMVALDRHSLARFDSSTDTPPSELQVPTGLFNDSANMETDLQKYAKQLSDASIRFRIFRMTVSVQSAKWANSN